MPLTWRSVTLRMHGHLDAQMIAFFSPWWWPPAKWSSPGYHHDDFPYLANRYRSTTRIYFKG